MPLPLKPLPDHPNDQLARAVWDSAEWRCIDGNWLPTAIKPAVGRVLLQQTSAEQWTMLIDGTPCRIGGKAMTWRSPVLAGYDALTMAGQDGYHGPALRFRTSQPWQPSPLHDGCLERSLLAVHKDGLPVELPATPVAVLRPSPANTVWHEDTDAWLPAGWSICLESTLTTRLQALDNRVVWPTADEARAVADNEVARWLTGRIVLR
jgi:hypothetical protein